MKSTKWRLRLAILAIVAGSVSLKGQSLVADALSSFPKDTIRIEYSHPSVLRALPDYSAMRQRYEGPKLQELESSFSKLGIQESDVDELVLGWRIQDQEWVFYGVTSGRFNGSTLAERAASQGFDANKIGEQTAFCSGGESSANCVVVLNDSLGEFGTFASLRAIAETRAGRLPSLGSESRLAKLIDEAETKDPIWGVAVGPAVPDWYRGWMPNQTNLKLDWNQAFKPVEALTYGVNPGETVRLNIAMDCDTAANAASLKQVFEGLRLYQQLSWQNQNPGRPNPYKSLEFHQSQDRILIKMETAYGDLTAPGTPGSSNN
jgi:hypothetical protein